MADPHKKFNRSLHYIPGMAEKIVKDNKRLQGYDWQILRGDQRANEGGGYLEFYPPEESHNPVPGKPTISVFDKGLSPQETQQMVFGDMLHYLPSVDSEFNDLRNKYRGLLTPEQQQIDKNAYQRGVDQYGENRPYEDWMNQSRLDAHIRGYLSPDKDDNWKGSYTEDQQQTLGEMRGLLSTPSKKKPSK